MNDKADRRMALLMEEEDLPEVIPPRPMTPAEKQAAVQSYLLTAEGQRAIQEAIDKEAGVITARIHRDELEAANDRHRRRITNEAAQARERARLARERVEAAAAVAAANEAARTEAPVPSRPTARDNSDYYRQQREEAQARTRMTNRTRGPLPVQFDTDSIEISDPFAGALDDL